MSAKALEFMIPVPGGQVRCVSFGQGGRPLVVLPGLSLRSLKGAGTMLAKMYRCFTEEFTVFVLDRRTPLPEPCTLSAMAWDAAEAITALHLPRADVIGISMGGMIAQCLALDRPELVGRLVLGVTAGRPNNTVRTVLREWIRLAEEGDTPGLVRDSLEKGFSEAALRRWRPLLPLLCKTVSVTDPESFVSQARAILHQDTWDRLGEISAPTLVLGGEEDRIVTAQGTRELAEKLGCRLVMFPGQGHGAYQEKAAEFNGLILEFLTGEGEKT